MAYKISNVRSNFIESDHILLTVLSFVRDTTLFAYFIIIFTAIDLLIPGTPATEELSSAGSLFWQIATTIFFGVGILLQITRQPSLRRVIVMATPLVPILIWIILSVTWSEFPDYTIRRGVRIAIEIIATILFAAAYRDQYKFLRVIYISLGAIVLADMAFLSMPDKSFGLDGYAGVHYHKNVTGIFYLLVSPLFFLAVIDRNIFPSRAVSVTLALSSVLLLIISLSKSAIALTPVSLFLTVGIIWLRRASPVTAFALILFTICAGVITVAIIASIGVDNFLIDLFGDATFTGRNRIWDHALSLFWQSPVIGQGYGSLWNVGIFSILQQQDLFSVAFFLRAGHNGYIEVLTELGIVGLLLTILFLFSTFYRLWLRIPSADIPPPITFLAIYIFFATLLENIVESSIFRSGNGFWIYFLLVIFASFFMIPESRRRFSG